GRSSDDAGGGRREGGRGRGGAEEKARGGRCLGGEYHQLVRRGLEEEASPALLLGQGPQAGPEQQDQQGRPRHRLQRCNLGGQYDDTFDDVQMQLMNYFTYKAVRTVLTQLYEMNPPSYRWFYNFVAVNKPTDGKLFLRALSKERQELAERVMVTRLHLYGKWIKKCDHGKMYEMISDENLKLMRERLMETVIWPTDDTNTEKIG
ncbi:hypothetical protein PVAP13_9NG063728, partial [Panicum virgatum]